MMIFTLAQFLNLPLRILVQTLTSSMNLPLHFIQSWSLLSTTHYYNNPLSLRTHLFHVDFKRSCGLTLGTWPGFDLLVLGLVEWSQNVVTLVTVVLDDTELGQHPRTTGHHPTGPDQLVQVKLSVKLQSKTSNIPQIICNLVFFSQVQWVKIWKKTFFKVKVKLQVKWLPLQLHTCVYLSYITFLYVCYTFAFVDLEGFKSF